MGGDANLEGKSQRQTPFLVLPKEKIVTGNLPHVLIPLEGLYLHFAE